MIGLLFDAAAWCYKHKIPILASIFLFLSGNSIKAQSTSSGNAIPGWGVTASGNTLKADSSVIMTVSRATDSITSLKASVALKTTLALALAGLSLTTTGSSGVATYNNNTGIFNIPQYAAASPTFNNTPSLTIQTVAAAANGNQLSATKNVTVSYSVTIVSTATIAGSQTGYVVLEIAATNSTTAADWTEIGRVPNGQAVSLAVVLQSVSTGGGSIHGVIPAGYYRRLRSVNVAGTPTFTYNSGQEVTY